MGREPHLETGEGRHLIGATDLDHRVDAEEDPASEGRAVMTKVSSCGGRGMRAELLFGARTRAPRDRGSPARGCRRRSSSRVKRMARVPQASAARCPTRERRGLVAPRSARGSVKRCRSSECRLRDCRLDRSSATRFGRFVGRGERHERVKGVRSRIPRRDRSRGATKLGSELSHHASAGLVPIARGERIEDVRGTPCGARRSKSRRAQCC